VARRSRDGRSSKQLFARFNLCRCLLYHPLKISKARNRDGDALPLPLGELAERSKYGYALPLPLGEVAERSEDGEGKLALTKQGPLSHLR
jgi:hypothetical protein